MKDELLRVLEALTVEQKHELDKLGIPAQRRTDWKKGRRLPTAAQLRTLAIVTDNNPAPWLLWLAQAEATPAQLDLFLKALAKATATLAITVLVAGQNDANAESMRVSGRFPSTEPHAHYAQYEAPKSADFRDPAAACWHLE